MKLLLDTRIWIWLLGGYQASVRQESFWVRWRGLGNFTSFMQGLWSGQKAF